MEIDYPESSGSSAPARPRVTGSSRWLRTVLLAAIVLLLISLVVVPVLIGRRAEMLRDRRAEIVFPAHDALQDSRSALSEALAAVRGYQLTGDTIFLTHLRDAVAREQAASDRLVGLARQLGPEPLRAAQDVTARSAEWLRGPRALLAGEASREQLVSTLTLGHRRFEAALGASAGARAALNRADTDLDGQIHAAMRLERSLVALLAIAALIVALVVAWLTSRLHWISKQLQARADGLKESEERFRLIAENLREMIWISDPEYSYQYYLSPAYEAIWGRSIESARKNPRSFLKAVVPEDRERVEAALEGYASGEYEAEYRIMRPDGQIRWLSGRAYPVHDEDGRVFRVVGIVEDITAQKKVAEERERLLDRERRAHAQTEAALRVRDQVLRIVSHDLKNPLHTIGMAADLLEMQLPDEQRNKQLGIIRRTVARADRMVLDLLDAARIQSGQAISIDPQPLQVRDLLTEAVEAFRFQAEEKHQRLECDIADGIAPVLADRDRGLQALSNLIGNAVKFTPEGGRIQVRAEPWENGAVRVSISDTGPGIPADILPHIFEPFTQARDTASLGTGLGLSIARGIVQAHGGQLGVQSEPGTGTTFDFTLPTTRSPDP